MKQKIINFLNKVVETIKGSKALTSLCAALFRAFTVFLSILLALGVASLIIDKI